MPADPIRLRLTCPFCSGAELALVAPARVRLDPGTVRCHAPCPACRAAAVAVEAWVATYGLERASYDTTPQPPGRRAGLLQALLARFRRR